MKFLTLTRIAALLATSGLASASIDVCAGGVQLECNKKAATLLGSLDSMDPLTAFRSVRTFLESGCDGACLSSELKAELCEKAHIIKSLIPQKIYLEDIEQCFSDTSVEEDSCHVSYECPPGTPEGNICVTNSCVSKVATAAARPPQCSLNEFHCDFWGNFYLSLLEEEPPFVQTFSNLRETFDSMPSHLCGYDCQSLRVDVCKKAHSIKNLTNEEAIELDKIEECRSYRAEGKCLKAGEFMVASRVRGPHNHECKKCCSEHCSHQDIPCFFLELAENLNAKICSVSVCAP